MVLGVYEDIQTPFKAFKDQRSPEVNDDVNGAKPKSSVPDDLGLALINQIKHYSADSFFFKFTVVAAF